ncbi:MAG: VapE domain-containing protein [Ginsengibacter sp.]
MTKIELLQQVSPTDIFKKYLPDFNPSSRKNYSSPFSDKDEKPSLSIYKDNAGELRFKSHNTGHQGDCFQFVADLFQLDSKKNFDQVIEKITKDFSLNGYAFPLKKQIRISYEKEFTPAFIRYFKKYKIDKETLIKFDVKQVKFHEFKSSSGKHCKFDYRGSKTIVACYVVDEKIKIYIPAIPGKQEKGFPFKDQTTEEIFGLKQQEKCETLWIAAGEKDSLALNANGFPSISFQSENTIPTAAQIKTITKLSKDIRIVYDNDEAGNKAADSLAKKTGWKCYRIPENFKDVADFFQEKTADDFKALCTFSETTKKENFSSAEEDDDKEIWTVFHQCEKYLSRVYDLRFNTIKLEIEIKRKEEEEFRPLNENSLYVEINKAGIKIGMDKLISILKSEFVNHYDPFIDYFSRLKKWDGVTDHIGKLCSYIKTHNDKDFTTQFKKWMMRAVKCATMKGYYNKQAFILIHNKQNSGKTTFCRFLCPPALMEYFAENISDDKDSRIAIAKNFLINLDELSSLAKHEINSLKALFSKDIINERLPYERKASIIHRVASFIGSTNMSEFLTDETGSVRWLCFEIKEIDWRYKREVNINRCWAQAVGMIKDGIPAELNREEIEENEARNAKFQQRSTEAEIIPNFLAPGKETDPDADFMTASDVLIYLSGFTSIRFSKVSIGRAMPICGFTRQKMRNTDRYGYWCIKLK